MKLEKITLKKIDKLGRIIIPIKIRNQFNIKERDSIEIFIEGNGIILKKYENYCIFCGNNKNLKKYKNKLICNKCMTDITKNLS